MGALPRWSLVMQRPSRCRKEKVKKHITVHKGEGEFVANKNTAHRMAEANKAFAHFAW